MQGQLLKYEILQIMPAVRRMQAEFKEDRGSFTSERFHVYTKVVEAWALVVYSNNVKAVEAMVLSSNDGCLVLAKSFNSFVKVEECA